MAPAGHQYASETQTPQSLQTFESMWTGCRVIPSRLTSRAATMAPSGHFGTQTPQRRQARLIL